MSDLKKEELTRILNDKTIDPNVYAQLPFRDLIMLTRMADQALQAQGLAAPRRPGRQGSPQGPDAAFFLGRKRMYLLMVLQRLQKSDALFTLICPATNLPYLACDQETYNDQVFLFSDEMFAQRVAESEEGSAHKLRVSKLENKQFLSFYLSLHAMGVNELLLNRGIHQLAVPLELLVKKPDFSKLPPEKQPVQNPTLFLTSIYFAQERTLDAEKQDLEALKELEEEMVANLKRGKVLVPVQLPENSDPETAVTPKDTRFLMMKLPNGTICLPVFTNPEELGKVAPKGKNMHAVAVMGEKLTQILGKQAQAVYLNPASVRLIIPVGKLS